MNRNRDRSGPAKPRGIAGAAGVLMMLLCIPALAGTAPEPAAEETQILFRSDLSWDLTLDGQPVAGATIYSSRQKPGLLIVSSSLGGALFTRFDDKRIVPVNPLKMHVQDDSLTLDTDGAWGTPLGNWWVEGPAAVFVVGGKKVRVAQRPPILGQTTTQEVMEKMPFCKTLFSQYTPDPSAIDFLKHYGDSINIEVYFGSWCPHCQQWLPQLLRTLNDCGNPNFHLLLYGLPPEHEKDLATREAKQVKGIPCVIVYRGGQEVGRIEGGPRESYEKDLGGLLRLASSRKG